MNSKHLLNDFLREATALAHTVQQHWIGTLIWVGVIGSIFLFLYPPVILMGLDGCSDYLQSKRKSKKRMHRVVKRALTILENQITDFLTQEPTEFDLDRFFEIMENIYGVRGLILGIEDAEFEVYSGYCNESAQAMHDGLRKFIRSKNYGEVVLLWQNHFERKEYYWLLNGFSQQDNPTMYKAMSDARALVWHEIHTHLSWRHTQLCVQSHKSTSVKLLEEFNELLGVASIFLDTDFFKHVYVSLLETFGPHIRALSEEKPAEFTALMERFVLEKTDVLDDGKSESEE